MVNQDLVSVVVCSYNNEKFVLDCLNSIFDQSYENIELLISDDCSIDKTYDLIKEWCESHKNRFTRCYYKQNEINLGISKNHNSILKMTKGEYIKTIAADDMLLNNAISNEVSFLNTHIECQIVYANCIIIDSKDHYPIVNVQNKEVFYKSFPKSGFDLVEDLIHDCFIATPTVMYRGDTFIKYGYFREDLNFEDWEYWIRLSKNGACVGYLDKLVVGYRIYIGSNSHTGIGHQEENKFIKNTLTEETILHENFNYISDVEWKRFWNRVLNTCYNLKYNNAIKLFITEKRVQLGMSNRIKFLLYKLNLYDVFINIYKRLRCIYT